MGTKVKLYEEIDVWRRLDRGGLQRYRSFRALSTGRYHVQSSDFISHSSTAELLRELDVNFLELLEEDAPDKRSAGYATLLEAIAAHDADFGFH
jgi:hypothetical protein